MIKLSFIPTEKSPNPTASEFMCDLSQLTENFSHFGFKTLFSEFFMCSLLLLTIVRVENGTTTFPSIFWELLLLFSFNPPSRAFFPDFLLLNSQESVLGAVLVEDLLLAWIYSLKLFLCFLKRFSTSACKCMPWQGEVIIFINNETAL